VLALLASFVFVFGKDLAGVNPTGFAVVKWAGASAAVVSSTALVVLFVLAGDPERLGHTMARLEQVLPSKLAGLIARIAEKFARGLGAIRRPGRLLAALAWSLPLWLCIALGIWSMAMAFRFAIPFTGSFLMIALLTLGVAVPTPGAVGGFHEAFRVGATAFYGAPDEAAVGAAIVLHLFSIGPALLLGLFFAAQEGLNLGGMQRLADQAEQGHTA
jgi:glycosyltransferase 2 family protein